MSTPNLPPTPTVVSVVEADAKSAWAKVHGSLQAILGHAETVARSVGWASLATLAFKVAQHII